MKKFISILLAAFISVASLAVGAGCASGSGEKKDSTRTQLYVNVLECGVGVDFLTSLKAAFEEEYKETSFEEGKKGVQVMITQSRIDGDNIISALAGDSIDVFYVANMDISTLVKLGDGTNVTSDYLEDITDIVTAGGENSIHAKMFDASKEYYNLSSVEDSPKYYALPWFESLAGGLVYDVGLFEEKHLYSKGVDSASNITYAGLDGIVGTDDDDAGPNGIKGIVDGVDYSYDDGLPATWEDFDILITAMTQKGVTPFAFTNLDDYTTSWLKTVWGSYEGKDNISLLKNFNGVYTYTDEDGETVTLEISENNGWQVSEQIGKKAAIAVGEYIIKNKLYEEQSFYASTDNIKAQKLYLGSKAGMYQGVQPIAFLLEGVWWENEAKDYFDELAGRKGADYAYGTRKFGVMPIPKFSGSEDDPFEGAIPKQVNYESSTLNFGTAKVTNYASGVFINKKSSRKELAKEFLKFAYSDEMNVDFNVVSGLPKPFDYVIPEDKLSEITYYQRQVYELLHNSSINKVSAVTRGKYILTQKDLITGLTSFTSGTGTNKKTNVFSAFKDNASLTLERYWNGISELNYKDTWEKVNWN